MEAKDWARTVISLILKARMDEARQACSRFKAYLAQSSATPSPQVYSQFHLWVALVCVHRAQLHFAAEILDQVPVEIKARDPQLSAVERRLNALELAELHGAFVPFRFIEPNWWLQGPFLTVPAPSGLRLKRWLAARLEAREDFVMHFLVAIVQHPAESAWPELARLSLSDEAFASYCLQPLPEAELQPGAFLEFHEFEGGSQEEILVAKHPHLAHVDPYLPDVVAFLRDFERIDATTHERKRTIETCRTQLAEVPVK